MPPKVSCQSPDVFGKAWLSTPTPDGNSLAQAYVWPSQAAPRLGAWTSTDPATCLSLPKGAGADIDVHALYTALTEMTGGAFYRQMLYRLGLDKLGTARMRLHQDTNARLAGQGTLEWPAPQRGPAAALGTAQPVVRPASVPPKALGFAAVSLSPGRAWQALEAFAGGLWPLEATLIGTQVSAWEQGSGHGQLAEDVLGYPSVLATAILLPSARGAQVVYRLPVAKPEVARGFMQWAIEVTSAFAPSLQAQAKVMQGQSMVLLRGLDRRAGAQRKTVYLAADKSALYASTDVASLIATLRDAARPDAIADAPLDSGAPKSAVAFASVEHAALPAAIWRNTRGGPLWQFLRLEPKGRSVGWVEASADGFVWQTSSGR